MPYQPRGRRGGRRAVLSISVLFAALAMLAAGTVSARADGIFIADCNFSHRATDDPIVLHGATGMSHSHDFFGNGATNAFSTFRSLRGHAGNCVPADDRSAYWTPTLYRN